MVSVWASWLIGSLLFRQLVHSGTNLVLFCPFLDVFSLKLDKTVIKLVQACERARLKKEKKSKIALSHLYNFYVKKCTFVSGMNAFCYCACLAK